MNVETKVLGWSPLVIMPLLFKKRNNLNSVQDMKSYVNEDLKTLKQQQKSLALRKFTFYVGLY